MTEKQMIYAEVATLAYKYNINIIPNSGKRPFGKNWQKYCDEKMSEPELKNFLNNYAYHNAGLPLGQKLPDGYYIIAIDVDDDRLEKFSKLFVGKKKLIAKKGKKGLTLFAKTKDRIKGSKHKLGGKGNPAIEALSYKNQTIVPPSIHPETKEPYIWINKEGLFYENFWEDLPVISESDLKLIKTVVTHNDIENILNGSATNDPTYKLMLKLYKLGLDYNKCREVFESLLPNGYKGNTLDELESIYNWCEGAAEEGKGNSTIDSQVARQVAADLSPLIYTELDGFLKYNNGCWSEVDRKQIQKLIKDELENYNLKGMLAPNIKFAEQCLLLDVHQSDFDYKRRNLICLDNGTFDIDEMELIDWSPDHNLRYKLDFPYNPEAKCPNYLKAINYTLKEDERSIETFEEFAGYTLTNSTKYQKALYLVGHAGSGKSTLLRTLISMHDNKAISTTPLQKIDDERHLTDLSSKLLCISFDVQPKERSKIFGEAWNRITGEDNITIRKLFNEVQGSVKARTRFIGGMNYKMPNFISSADAVKRRLLLLECNKRVDNPDTELESKIYIERSGIFNRWIKALKRLEDRGNFLPPKSGQELLEDYIVGGDPIKNFIENACEVVDKPSTETREIYTAYTLWCDANGERKVPNNVFGKALKELGIEVGFGKDIKNKTIRLYNLDLKNMSEF